jgi:ATP-dependent Zn protease
MDQVWIDLIVSWLPFLLLIGVLIAAARMVQRRSRAPSGRTTAELYELQLEEMKRHTTALERIAQALESRRHA